MKNFLGLILAVVFSNSGFSQTTINQNGLQTTVIKGLTAQATQAKRFEIANIGYNSFHWQYGGLIIIEIYQAYFSNDYKKYVIQNGFGEGVNSGSAILKLVETHGNQYLGKIVLGTPVDISSTFGGYTNRQLPIYFDVQNYASYTVKISYQQPKVDTITDYNQIKINETPTGTNIANFTVSGELNTNIITNGLLRVSGSGNHYVQNGNVGIGTTNPTSKLTVAGNIAAREVKVTVDAGADFVFEKDYSLQSLESVDKFIKENKHLPEIASAEEMKKDGINLSEMNIKLLQKIEELTLYSIQQNKKIEEQSKEIESLKSLALRIAKLENQSAQK